MEGRRRVVAHAFGNLIDFQAGGGGVGEVSGREVVELFDEEVAILCRGLDGKSALAWPLNADAGVCREARLLLALKIVELLAVLRALSL